MRAHTAATPAKTTRWRTGESVSGLVQRAERILDAIVSFGEAPGSLPVRRLAAGASRELHLERILRSLGSNRPVQLVLPAFPAKSPNPRKTLGALPDFGEVLGLQRLEALCRQIRQWHTPGARLIICSDGRVFSDLVRVSDTDVDRYSRGLRSIIEAYGLTSLSTFNLDDVFPGLTFDEMRAVLTQRYGTPVELLRRDVADRDDARRLFNGIHRFVFEDRLALEAAQSRNRVRESAKEVAYQVIQRSNAWSRLVERCFPNAVRLSIHPQPADSTKIWVRLVACSDAWGTPWHNVALFDGDRFTLVPRHEAESRGATVVFSAAGGYPYYTLVRGGEA